MAAPSGTVWGSAVGSGSQARIGLYITTSSSNTQTTISVQVWFWSKWGVDEHWGNNTLYFNFGSTSATTSVGGVEFQTTVSTGSGWSTSNQVKIYSASHTYNKSTSAQTVNIASRLTAIETIGSTMSVSSSASVPALAKYTISYNANGGSGAPGSQTKYYGTTLTLSSTRPERDGYRFVGWATSSSATSATYSPGGSYTANASATLYAVWAVDVFVISYNANGGSGAPTSQSKQNGVTLVLTTTKPVRTRHTFLGWSTSPDASSATYEAGGNFTDNADTLLYAVWKLDNDDVRIFSDGKIEAVEFVEGQSSIQIQDGGVVQCTELIEELNSDVKLGSTSYANTFYEI